MTFGPSALCAFLGRQLRRAGYALFDAEDAFGIDSVGLYLARQAQLVTWPLEEFMSMLSVEGKTPLPLDTARQALRAWLGA